MLVIMQPKPTNMMRTYLTLLLFSLLSASISLAQNEIPSTINYKELAEAHYLLGADPTHPKVAAFIERNGGTPWISDGTNPEDIGFKYWTEQMPKNKYMASSDHRYLISKVAVRKPELLKKVLPEIGYYYNYADGVEAKHDSFPKVAKKYTGATVKLGHDPFYGEYKDFSDTWYGTVSYSRNNNKELVAKSIEFVFRKHYSEKALTYNPKGWHNFDTRLVCETGNCVLCGVGKLEALKGVTVKENKSNPDIITLNVAEFEGEMPLGISEDVSYDDLIKRFGMDYPWAADTIYTFYTKKEQPIEFYFENGKLEKIVSQEFQDCEDFVPIQIKIRDSIITKDKGADSPAIVEYTGSYYYYGQRKNGLPHGYGALTGSKFTYFENGKGVSEDKPDVPVCIDGGCDDYGTIITDYGVYKGQMANGRPHGKGRVIFAYVDKWTDYSGDFIDGRPNPPPPEPIAAKEENKNKFDPAKQEWEEYFAQVVSEYNRVDKIDLFRKMAGAFYNSADECDRWEHRVYTTSHLYYCMTDNYREYIWLEAPSNARQLRKGWDAVAESFEHVQCGYYLHDKMKECSENMKTFMWHAENIESYVKSVEEQLQVPAVQKNFSLAKSMYASGISSIQGYVSEVENHFESFIKSLNELDEAVKSTSCSYQE